MDLLEEEVFYDHVSVDASSNISIIDFGLLEVGCEIEFKGLEDGTLNRLKVKFVVPV